MEHHKKAMGAKQKQHNHWIPWGLSPWLLSSSFVFFILPFFQGNQKIIHQKSGKVFARSLCFSVMWGAVIGSMTTLLGGARGPLAIAILEKSQTQKRQRGRFFLLRKVSITAMN